MLQQVKRNRLAGCNHGCHIFKELGWGGGVVSGLILDLKSESSELLFPEPIMISSIQEHKSHSDYLLI